MITNTLHQTSTMMTLLQKQLHLMTLLQKQLYLMTLALVTHLASRVIIANVTVLLSTLSTQTTDVAILLPLHLKKTILYPRTNVVVIDTAKSLTNVEMTLLLQWVLQEAALYLHTTRNPSAPSLLFSPSLLSPCRTSTCCSATYTRPSPTSAS
jgi:hypothetical protein